MPKPIWYSVWLNWNTGTWQPSSRKIDLSTPCLPIDPNFLAASAQIDYSLYIQQGKYYQTIFHLIFMMLGFRTEAEVQTNQGRIDAVVEVSDHIFLFEFKLDGSEEEALQQIKDRAYYQKYQRKGKPITLIGANFASVQRQVVKWKEKAA